MCVMDAIQRKLAILDDVSPWQNLSGFITQSCPLLLPCLGLMIGIVVQDKLALPQYSLCLLLGLPFAGVFLVKRKVIKNQSLYLAWCAGLAFVGLGALRVASFRHVQAQDMRALVQAKTRMVTLRGTVGSIPYVEQPNWTFAPACHLAPATTFDLKAESLLTTLGWQSVQATVRVRIAEPVHGLKPPQRIELYGWLDRFGPPANPGQFDIQEHLGRQNIHLWVSVKSRLGIAELAPTRGHYFSRLQHALRQRVSQALLADLGADAETRGLLQALLLGYRRDINSDTYVAFKQTGLLHFISLSGMHMGILVALIWWICRTAGLLKRGRALICTIALVLFMLVVPPRAPTLRAAIICWVFCLSFFFRRRPHPFNTLCLAALILLLTRPTQVFDVGWQLSFASVLGILMLAQPLYDRVTVALSSLSFGESLTTRLHPVLLKVGCGMLSLLCVGLAAWLGGAGILLYHFYRVTPLACVWTVLVFPVVALILALGFLKIVLFFCLPWAGGSMAWVLSLGVKGLVVMVKGIDSLDNTSILVGRIGVGWILAYYVSVFVMCFVPVRRMRVKWTLRIGLMFTLLVGIGGQRYKNRHPDGFSLTCLDVGHGQALVIQGPGMENILLDAGSLYRRDIGRCVVIPFLEYQGIDRLDRAILSHNDTDHINGIPEVVADCPTDRLCVPLAFAQGDRPGPPLDILRRWLKQGGRELKTLGDTIPAGGDVRIRILWPTSACQNELLSDNDRSLVALIEFAGRTILVCSDIEQYAQQRLQALDPGLDVDVLIAPHHGSLTTLAPGFVAQLKPEIIVCSCSRSQWQKQRVIQPRPGYDVLYTAVHGAVEIRIDSEGNLEAKPWLEHSGDRNQR